MLRPASSVVESFAKQAAAAPERIAIASTHGRLSYAELLRRAEAVQRLLLSKGVEADDRIAIQVPRSAGMVAAVIGVLASGCAYVPVGPTDPPERKRRIVQRSGARCVFAGEMGLESVQAPSPRDVGDARADVSEGLRVIEGRGRLAYVVYTSGSTGEPKGVAMEHDALLNLLEWQHNFWRETLSGEPVVSLQFTPLTFDVSFLEIMATLTSGGTLVLPSEAERRDPAQLLALVARERVSAMFVPRVLLRQLAGTALIEHQFPASLRIVSTGGEQLVIDETVADWFRGMPSCILQNIYGPTEAHVVTTHELYGTPDAWPRRVPIGRPIPGAALSLRDPDLEPVADGAIGEICIQGVCLARGYFGEQELTRRRFGPHREGAPRMYRTGDLARSLPDGTLEYLGREDSQVKVQGVCADMVGLEQVLLEHRDVTLCAIRAWPDRSGSSRLAAYVVLRAGAGSLACGFLQRHMAERVPEGLVPRWFVAVDSLPTTTSGKVDHKLLPEPSRDRPQLDVAYRAPRSRLEAVLADSWKDVLQLDQVGIDDSFFELGGTSLLLVELRLRIIEATQASLSVAELLEHPTVAKLAAHIDGGEDKRSDTTVRRARRRAFRRRGQRSDG